MRNRAQSSWPSLWAVGRAVEKGWSSGPSLLPGPSVPTSYTQLCIHPIHPPPAPAALQPPRETVCDAVECKNIYATKTQQADSTGYKYWVVCGKIPLNCFLPPGSGGLQVEGTALGERRAGVTTEDLLRATCFISVMSESFLNPLWESLPSLSDTQAWRSPSCGQGHTVIQQAWGSSSSSKLGVVGKPSPAMADLSRDRERLGLQMLFPSHLPWLPSALQRKNILLAMAFKVAWPGSCHLPEPSSCHGHRALSHSLLDFSQGRYRLGAFCLSMCCSLDQASCSPPAASTLGPQLKHQLLRRGPQPPPLLRSLSLQDWGHSGNRVGRCGG